MSLIEAVKEGDLEKVRKLIKTGVNVNQTILKKRGFLKQLTTKKKVDWDEAINFTPLHAAVNNHGRNYINILKELLAHPNIKLDIVDNKYKNTPLHLATKNHNIDAMKLLIEAGANVNALNKARQSPLSVANSIEEIKILIEAGAKNVVSATGDTTLTDILNDQGSDPNIKSIVMEFINIGVDINRRHKTQYIQGPTPLDAYINHVKNRILDNNKINDTINFLLSKGVIISPKNSKELNEIGFIYKPQNEFLSITEKLSNVINEVFDKDKINQKNVDYIAKEIINSGRSLQTFRNETNSIINIINEFQRFADITKRRRYIELKNKLEATLLALDMSLTENFKPTAPPLEKTEIEPSVPEISPPKEHSDENSIEELLNIPPPTYEEYMKYNIPSDPPEFEFPDVPSDSPEFEFPDVPSDSPEFKSSKHKGKEKAF